LEHAHRSAVENHVHRPPRLGSRRSLNLRIGISVIFWQRAYVEVLQPPELRPPAGFGIAIGAIQASHYLSCRRLCRTIVAATDTSQIPPSAPVDIQSSRTS
jgi:hypothetical protein